MDVNKMYFFSFLSPISTSSKSPIKHCNSKKFRMLRNILRKILLFFTNFSQDILKKNLSNECTEIKHNLLHCNECTEIKHNLLH